MRCPACLPVLVMTSSPSPDKIHTQPEISVIIPVYNSELYLKECLDSLLEQTFGDWEAICINDGSTDGSAEILADYAARDPRIHVFSQENRGLGATRNKGITEAHGRYIAFLDSDDMFNPDFLEQLYAEAQSSGADVVMGSTRYESPKKAHLDAVPAAGEALNTFMERVMALPHGGACNKIYLSTMLREHDLRFHEGVYWEDNLFTLRVCHEAHIFVTQPTAIYRYIMHENSIVHHHEYAEKRKKDALSVVRNIMLFCAEKGCSETERATVAAFCLRNVISKENLCDPDYYAELEGGLGPSQQLFALRRKALRRMRRKKIYAVLHKMLRYCSGK